MNQERFHNQLALHLGYKRILDKRMNIRIDEKREDPIVIIAGINTNQMLSFYASEEIETIWSKDITEKQKEAIQEMGAEKEIDAIISAVHQAYIDANTNRF